MNPRHYHNPVGPGPARARCPVCHEAVYSKAGIHPQCAVRLADPPKPKSKPGIPAVVAAIAEGGDPVAS